MLDAAPQALNKNVVKGSAAPVHTDAFAFEKPGEDLTGELAVPSVQRQLSLVAKLQRWQGAGQACAPQVLVVEAQA